MNAKRLCFIGAGNMARSLIGGLVADGWDPSAISVADPDTRQLTDLTTLFRVHTGSDNAALAGAADVVVLAVKPQVMQDVASGIAASVGASSALVISVAAGIRSRDLERWLGGERPVVRCMPNTPALVQSGATALFANAAVSREQKDLAESILRAVGLAIWIEDEALMDAVTAVSGSGPAYFFLVIEMLQATGVELGLDEKTARLLALQTAFGAAKMALESQDEAATLRQKVTSPGGTTERALGVLEDGGIRDLFTAALSAARERSRELAERFGAD